MNAALTVVVVLVMVEHVAFQITVFFLACVAVAGIAGAITVSRRIFFVQALPAIVGLALAWASR